MHLQIQMLIPNAFEYWNYYSIYLKGIRFSKRDFIAKLLYLAVHSISADTGNELADLIIQQEIGIYCS